MAEPVLATVDGVELHLCDGDFGPDNQDHWMAWGAWDGPNSPATISEWRKRIAEWRIAKQMASGFEVWNISDERPKYWEKRPAVFRTGTPSSEPRTYYGNATHRVHTRNGRYDPDSLYAIDRVKCAPDTPEAASAIEEARRLHAKAVEAGRRFKDAVKAIPLLSEDEWLKLPEKPDGKGNAEI